jgi:hypothetical protein
MSSTLRLLLLLPLLPFLSAAEDIKFVSIGDWGGASLGGYHLKNVQQTALAMSQTDSDFIINTGDSFYYCGIQNVSDPQIEEDYMQIFHNRLQSPGQMWYSVLGNHDYGFSPDAQIELPKVIPEWVMDQRYYWRRIVSPNTTRSGVVVNLIALDTSPCVNDYRENDSAKWDPCGKEFPTCAPQPGECRFHANILEQECLPQVEWLKNVLDKIPKSEWTIVVGHHRADELEFPAHTFPFQSLLDRPDVDLYINGHVHSLEHYSINGNAKYVTSGAASMVLNRGLRGVRGVRGIKAKRLWSKLSTGYIFHTITHDGYLISEFRDSRTNKVLHAFNVSAPV